MSEMVPDALERVGYTALLLWSDIINLHAYDRKFKLPSINCCGDDFFGNCISQTATIKTCFRV